MAETGKTLYETDRTVMLAFSSIMRNANDRERDLLRVGADLCALGYAPRDVRSAIDSALRHEWWSQAGIHSVQVFLLKTYLQRPDMRAAASERLFDAWVQDYPGASESWSRARLFDEFVSVRRLVDDSLAAK